MSRDIGWTPVLAAAAVALTVTACEGGSYRIVVGFEPPALADDVVRVEVYLVESCFDQPRDGGDPVGTMREIAITRAGAWGSIGSVTEGSYGLYARGRSATCDVVASGCEQVTLRSGGAGTLRITIEPEDPGLGCAEGARCIDGECAPATADAGSDAGPDAGEADSGQADAGPECIDPSCPAGCHPTERRCARVLPSNVSPTLIDSAASPITVDTAETWDTTACDRPGMTVATQESGGEVCVLRAGTFEVAAALTVTGSRPLVVLAESDVTITGQIDVSAYGTVPGPGGHGGAGAGGNGAHVDPTDDGGGGGGGACGVGGAGGRSSSAVGGASGPAHAADFMLQPLIGGAVGGRGADDVSGGAGGGGGGALQITSQTSIALTGAILAAGGGAEGGRVPTSATNRGAGGGGGGGGSVLLEAPVVTLGSIVASGGGGGGGSGGGVVGGDGTDGATSLDARPSGGVGGEPAAGDGGQGGGGATLAGDPGEAVTSPDNGGGGGGGAGCIRFRTLGALDPTGGRTNPSTSPGVWTDRLLTD